ncbi:hypothetical protein DC852_26720 [Vibrio parahaemolyticus]|nr:hypothetical protein BWP24_26885 [Vibrio campbellii]EGR1444683.1 hypothetical protein [Vibrio parahaemolyticus]EGR3454168.1 hypothetical protein [Vibrio parahaemolyticus]EGR3506767.1 hypothetical protein [Vibrio parahaemolyticus]OQT73332.1 hypothetical protein EM98_023260 [Vibrio parahaemolyticus]
MGILLAGQKMKVTVHNFYITNGKIIGQVGDNDMGLTQGRFFSAEFQKKTPNAVYCELGIKYEFGKASETPIGDLVKEKLFDLQFEITQGSIVAKAQELLRETFGVETTPSVISEVQYKTRLVRKLEWSFFGRKITMTESIDHSGYSELSI